MLDTYAKARPRSAPWGAVSLGIAVVALVAFLPSWGFSCVLGALGLLLGLPGLRTRDRSLAVVWIALILNAALFGFFLWLVLLYDWG